MKTGSVGSTSNDHYRRFVSGAPDVAHALNALVDAKRRELEEAADRGCQRTRLRTYSAAIGVRTSAMDRRPAEVRPPADAPWAVNWRRCGTSVNRGVSAGIAGACRAGRNLV